MPECHKCPYNGRATKRCLHCRGPSDEPPHHGMQFISLDRLPEKDFATLQVPEPEPEPEHPIAEFVRFWARLPPLSREVLTRVIVAGSWDLATLAHDLKLTRQAVSDRIRKIATLFPELKSVLPLPRKPEPETSAQGGNDLNGQK